MLHTHRVLYRWPGVFLYLTNDAFLSESSVQSIFTVCIFLKRLNENKRTSAVMLFAFPETSAVSSKHVLICIPSALSRECCRIIQRGERRKMKGRNETEEGKTEGEKSNAETKEAKSLDATLQPGLMSISAVTHSL